MTRFQDLAYQVSLTLGDHADDYDIDGIVKDLLNVHDGELTSIDDVDSELYWDIVKKHDATAPTSEDNAPTTTAWLGVQKGVLIHGESPEIMVINHRPGDSIEVMPSTPLPVSLDADHDAMTDAAETALKAAGWEIAGDWDAVDTGYTVPVRRA
ncbi:hypothetical protein ACFQWA_27905 [Streptomyces thermogriseus]|uniref:Uncharacterized protein n=1 Tax=Streptomyces thermogriseus TaxID=75292 RepID=A0ABN1T0Q9_9ACTN